jgi:hypothetical protein
LNEKDLPLLMQFQTFFGGIGTLTYDKGDVVGLHHLWLLNYQIPGTP